MEKQEEKLLETLMRLTKDQFRHFKWFVKRSVLEGFSGIPEAQLEEAERLETVDLMVQSYQRSGALMVTLEVLRKISRNDLVQDLLEASKHDKDNLQHGEQRMKAELKEKTERMIHDRQMKIKEIRHSAAVSKKSAERYISDSERTFQVLLQNVRRSQGQLVAEIQEMQEATQKQADTFIQELEQEIQQLTKTWQEAALPSAPTGSRQLLPSIPTAREWAEVSISPPPYGRTVASTLHQLEKSLREEKEQLIARAKLIRVREFSKDVTFDPDTANAFLVLSADRKRVHCGDVRQNLAHNTRRFQKACNVLGVPGCSSGRFYFQVQVEGLASWDVGVARESVERSSSISASPETGFWTICLRNRTQYKAPGLELHPKQPPKKVGVFVDYEGASVSFFDVDSAHQLHQFTQCCFSKQLLPFFSPGRSSPCRNPPSLVICPVSYDL